MSLAKRLLDQQQAQRKSRRGLIFENTEPVAELRRGRNTTSMLQLPIDWEKYNGELQAWGRKTAAIIRASAGQFTSGSGELKKSIGVNYGRHGIEIERIGFKLVRHGVFLEKGVGRGYVFNGAGVNRIAKSEPEGRQRYAVSWFNRPLSKELPELQEIVRRNTQEAIELNLQRIYIL
jgi:hypothetical protein